VAGIVILGLEFEVIRISVLPVVRYNLEETVRPDSEKPRPEKARREKVRHLISR
jgi:hypothetical protein